MVDEGFAVYFFDYKDVTSDKNDFTNGIAPLFIKGETREADEPGKIMMWAFCAMRVMDYLVSENATDTENVTVIGHSRLGKTALVTGAFDERFKFVISNDSGCSGAAITRGKVGEQISDITKNFPYWFCENYKKYRDATDSMPIEQNFLTSLIAPRHLIVGSAEEDIWADPESEFLGALMANEAYGIYGMQGLIHSDEIPKAKAVLSEGDSCYHVRHGGHSTAIARTAPTSSLNCSSPTCTTCWAWFRRQCSTWPASWRLSSLATMSTTTPLTTWRTRSTTTASS
jgi:hypothetical protein